MITEEEAFWAGIAVAVMMLGGGFSMLFLHSFTGYGAVVLALGLMTMALTMQMRAKPNGGFEAPRPYESQVITSSPPVESQRETAEEQPAPSPEPSQVEANIEQPSSSEPAETSEHVEPQQPAEEVKPSEPAENVEPTPAEPTQPIQPVEQPTQPQAPVEEKTEPPTGEKKPIEEPQVVPATN